MQRVIEIEGYTPDELLAMPDEQIRAFVFTDEPLVFRVGTAEILGSFRLVDQRLIVELAHIDSGGEGVLPTLAVVCDRYARQRNLRSVEWIVHAVHCANPNPGLRRVLELRGFVVEDIPGVGAAYHLVRELA